MPRNKNPLTIGLLVAAGFGIGSLGYTVGRVQSESKNKIQIQQLEEQALRNQNGLLDRIDLQTLERLNLRKQAIELRQKIDLLNAQIVSVEAREDYTSEVIDETPNETTSRLDFQ